MTHTPGIEQLDAEGQTLVAENIGLAFYLARDFWKNNGGDIEEYRSEASLAMVRSALTYRVDSGVPFGAYSRWKILRALLDWRRQSRLKGFRVKTDGAPKVHQVDTPPEPSRRRR